MSLAKTFMRVMVASVLVGSALADDQRYSQMERPSPDGIGKVYMGREISHVMGHQGAAWLEREERAREERPDLLMEALKISEGQVVADIGAGTGYYTRRLANAVGLKGKVLAVDIQQEMLDLLDANLKREGITNVEGVLGKIDDPGLPANAVDLALMVDVYHEFSHPYEMTAAMVKALKPGGRLVWVEYRAEDPEVPIKRLHKMSEAQVRKEAEVHGLVHLETNPVLPWQHIIIYQKPVRREVSDVSGKPVNPFVGAETGTLLVFVTHDCPISNRYTPEIQRLFAKFEKGGVRTRLVYADPDLTTAEISTHLDEYGYSRDIAILDPAHDLVKLSQVAVTPEAAFFSPARELLYHGRIDDRFPAFGKARQAPRTRDLEDFVDAVIRGEAPAPKVTKAIGCYIPDLK